MGSASSSLSTQRTRLYPSTGHQRVSSLLELVHFMKLSLNEDFLFLHIHSK